MKFRSYQIQQIDDNLFEIKQGEGMRCPGRIYASPRMMESLLEEEEPLQQVVNVAHLPGIQKYSLAMPDIHWGYGFPIGGVAAMDWQEGVISPGGVGYDINCGVRLAATDLTVEEVRPKLERLIHRLFQIIPTGVGSSGAIKKLGKQDLRRLVREGPKWVIEHGFGEADDLHFIEENGRMDWADPSAVSDRAMERGQPQMGTLGSGNHFLEVDRVETIYDPRAAQVMGLRQDQIVVLIHTGSRGFGYQVCDDHLKEMGKAVVKYGIRLPDRQLAAAPIQSPEGEKYLQAMACAANYAWSNRQVIMALAKQAFEEALGVSPGDLNFRLVYDVSHNIAKKEVHRINGEAKTVCVHRKGATRAFPPDSPFIPEKYRAIGQPVLIPGDMGRYSFVCVGTENALHETFGSTCHGAGRLLSRHKAKKMAKGRDLFKEMADLGVVVEARGRATVAEEMPVAYKDVADVVQVMHDSGISTKVAKLKPLGVIKG
ncbi:MAG TPA: RtcB family protein [Caldithrix abyssi]|uniref:tRNA-splicing ligase RtcB n=1 Tax=Caldithrix abyssi TaxID=187145 RepID=A0A7V5PNL8_CALAY|nr:RtcB family protein [Caldithrix abyssi]